jgi:hypothetical protein
MRMRIASWMVTAAALACITAAPVPARAQQKAAAKAPRKSAPTPRTADGKVDLSGIWSADPHFITDLNDALAPGESVPLQPWAAKLVKERMAKDDPTAHCLPAGVPRQVPHPWRLVQTPAITFVLFEGNTHSFRQIFTDGRPHAEDPDPTWYGDSIAKWEGDTLAVDSVGFNEVFWFDFAGHPHTEKLHIVERFRRPDFDRLDYDVTIDDPGAYTKPFTLHGHSKYEYNTELFEYVCNENNQDVEHLVGKDSRNKYTKP